MVLNKLNEIKRYFESNSLNQRLTMADINQFDLIPYNRRLTVDVYFMYIALLKNSPWCGFYVVIPLSFHESENKLYSDKYVAIVSMAVLTNVSLLNKVIDFSIFYFTFLKYYQKRYEI